MGELLSMCVSFFVKDSFQNNMVHLKVLIL